jgi:hypothetical protein
VWPSTGPEAFDSYERHACRQSIASIEAILANTEAGMVQVSTGDLALALGMKVYERQNCVQAWAEAEWVPFPRQLQAH